MITIQAERPREVNTWRAAGILYGDLGTSKAYVLGLAFALAGYSSFWFILAVSILTFLVGLNYIEICKLYPNGGGVYTSARNRSKVLALIGGFFLISDYIITAAVSAVSAFHYLGVSQPEYWAILSIAILGLFNLVGPKFTGNLAIGLALPTIICLICLGTVSLPFIPKAIQNLTPISGNLKEDWNIFVSIIVALSGIESIANTTGSMKLDPGSTYARPSVGMTSTSAVLIVIVEVCIFTSLLGLVMNALPGLEIHNGNVDAPGHPNVRDSMLRYMAEIFAGTLFGTAMGYFFSLIISVVIALLLLSAVNTALIGLTSLLFIMSKDGEMPQVFQKLNRFGVPTSSTFAAFLLPILVLIFISDILGLASLYAIGFVGAIAVNLGATSTNFALRLETWKRVLMFGTFVIMLLIEITLFIDKPHARIFILAVLGLGFLLRAFVGKRKERVVPPPVPEKVPWRRIPEGIKESSLVAVTGVHKSLDFALEEAEKHNLPLYILFIREQRFVAETDEYRSWTNDQEAAQVFNYVLNVAPKIPIEILYHVTPHTAHSIVEIAKLKKSNKIIIGRKRKFSLIHVLRGTTNAAFYKLVPKDIELLFVY